jgi:hypothetical protein
MENIAKYHTDCGSPPLPLPFPSLPSRNPHSERATWQSALEEFKPEISFLPLRETNARRVGLLATKLGMTHTYNKWGSRIPLTALQVRGHTL